LNLVLMTDSAVAHLAGTRRRPVRVLLNRLPHWLWLLDHSNSPGIARWCSFASAPAATGTASSARPRPGVGIPQTIPIQADEEIE
jgi:hypothetical protein